MPRTARISHADCVAVMEEAMERKGGVVCLFDNQVDANAYRMRLYQCRNAEKKESKEAYPPGDENYNFSIYDRLVMKVREQPNGMWSLTIINSIDLVPRMIDGATGEPIDDSSSRFSDRGLSEDEGDDLSVRVVEEDAKGD